MQLSNTQCGQQQREFAAKKLKHRAALFVAARMRPSNNQCHQQQPVLAAKKLKHRAALAAAGMGTGPWQDNGFPQGYAVLMESPCLAQAGAPPTPSAQAERRLQDRYMRTTAGEMDRTIT